MARRDVEGHIDMTELPKETHLSEIAEKTVGATNDDDWFEETTDAIPSRLPEELLSENAKKTILCLLSVDDSDAVAEKLDITTTTVNRTRQICSAFYEPSELPFDIYDEPSWGSVSVIRKATQHPDSRDDIPTLTRDDVESRGPKTKSKENQSKQAEKETGTTEITREILGRYYELDQSTSEIAEELDLEETSVVPGHLSAKRYIDREDWIVPDQSKSNTCETNDGDTQPDGSESTSFQADATTVEPDVSACDCSIPSLSVESATAGPSHLQSLYCEKCNHEFTAIYSKGDSV
jgi:hypothetical protein